MDRHDPVEWCGKYKRDKWLDAIVKRVPVGAEIGMEACASSHHWARALQARGYRVKLVAAQFVKHYVKSNKNDRADAAAICEAMARPHMRFPASGCAKPHGGCRSCHHMATCLLQVEGVLQAKPVALGGTEVT